MGLTFFLSPLIDFLGVGIVFALNLRTSPLFSTTLPLCMSMTFLLLPPVSFLPSQSQKEGCAYLIRDVEMAFYQRFCRYLSKYFSTRLKKKTENLYFLLSNLTKLRFFLSVKYREKQGQRQPWAGELCSGKHSLCVRVVTH